MFGWRRVTHTSPPARAYAFWVFFVTAHVHGAHVQGLQPQTPMLQVQDSGLQLHPSCLCVDFILHFSFHTCRRGSAENLTVLVSWLSPNGRAERYSLRQSSCRSLASRKTDNRPGSRAGQQTVTPPLGQRSMQETLITCSRCSGCSLLKRLTLFFIFARSRDSLCCFSFFWHLRQARITSPAHDAG